MSVVTSEPSSPAISLSNFNIRTTPSKVQVTIIGKIRAFHTITVLEWVYLALSIVGLTTSLGLTLQRIGSEKLDSSDFTFVILLLLTIVFCYYYVVHAVLTERADELMVFVISNATVLVYCIANYIMFSASTIKLVRLIVVSVLSPFLIIVGLIQSYTYCGSNNLIFNTVGGITSLQKACKMFYFCSSLLKFDLQLQLSMLILVMGKSGTAMDFTQKIILGSGVFLTLIFITVGFFGLKYESQALMIIFYILGLLEPGYVAYKFYYAGIHEINSATYESTFVCGCFALVVWLTLMVASGYFTTKFFGKGLKERMFEEQTNTKAPFVPALDVEGPSGDTDKY